MNEGQWLANTGVWVSKGRFGVIASNKRTEKLLYAKQSTPFI